MREYKLTEVERLQLANQFAILEKLEELDPETAKHYSKLRRIVERGYTIFYGEVFRDIDEPISMEECQYVFDVLDMYRALDRGYQALTDKSAIDAEDIRFKGFDGNNESEHLSLAEYLQEDGRWTESLKGDLNSHSMMRHIYEQMLERWNAIRQRSADKWPVLTASQIKEILS